MTLDFSLGEFAALVAKALRGAGYSWGLAADGAHSARVLATHSLPAAEAIAALLRVVDDTELRDLRAATRSSQAGDHALCPIALGAALSDLGDGAVDAAETLTNGRPVLVPLLVAPWLDRVTLVWQNGRIEVDDTEIRCTGDALARSATIQVEPFEGRPDGEQPGSSPSTRASVDPATYELLLDFASRTYAPATEASRATGAGSGLAVDD